MHYIYRSTYKSVSLLTYEKRQLYIPKPGNVGLDVDLI